MPIQKAAFKSLRQSKKRRLRNLRAKNTVKLLKKRAMKAIEKKDRAQAEESIRQAIRAIDKNAGRGILKKNTAARKKSRLLKKLRILGG